ncbi:dynamin family protein [Lysinibacillus capsici]|uniref:dynamin family protein n=1 Tax=Lysinibacillus TaxID=400634 RepID=UPI0006539EA4|nr:MULTISPECIES: dynamin family protein [Lysinibacillus]KMN40108.1 GTP-binding protein [Lysinibacillus sp. LK3]MCR6521779.1 GTP-binding protein [Lysinibacillus capsici]MCS5501556.1 GTP-binding protein [Lysinibacillus sp. A4]MCT1540659.1 GTP-binding protein [Lysinibacillus capsici]MCT1571897.1 GTP-binding protein [Lysinibacillus capsici]
MTNIDNTPIENTTSANNILPQFVDQLRHLYGIIVQNTYVKDTAKHLNRIIQDANNQTMILIVGKERVGKTTLVNGLLGREILSVDDQHPTSVNTFIRYGEQEEIKAYFLDGVVAVFDLSKLELLTTGDTFASQILREHLDYLEVYLKNDLLKSVTIIDSVSLEAGGGEMAYFSEALMNRVDEIFWVLRAGSMAMDAELLLIETLKNKGVEPLCVINGIDDEEHATAFMDSEQQRIGHLMSDFIGISAINALVAKQTDSHELWQKSQYDQLIAHIHRVAENSDKKTYAILIRFLQWLERFRFELTVIPQRDPFQSAVENIEKYAGDTQYEYSRYQRDLAIVKEYEQEYEQVANTFKQVQTLYQLLQTIAQHDYLHDSKVEEFTEIAVHYQQMLREYRNMHSEYLREYERLDAQHKKIHGKGLMKAFFGQHTQNEFFKERVQKLNEQQEVCVAQYAKVQQAEVSMLQAIRDTQPFLIDLVKVRMSRIEQKVQKLNQQRAKDKRQLKRYAEKLNEFSCLIEAQGYIKEHLQPFLMNEQMPLKSKDIAMLEETVQAILAIDLSNNGLLARSQMNNKMESIAIPFEVQEKYPLQMLDLREEDVKSNDIPEIPKKLVVQYED